MGSQKQEEFQQEYQAGKIAFERGQYRTSVERLEKACSLVARQSRLGGEIRMWLVTAYQAANQTQEAIALCQQLERHSNAEIRKQSKELLYIIKAPPLKRPQEWMTKIPDLSAMPESDPKERRGSGTVKSSQKKRPTSEPEPLDWSQVNTKDNQFVWAALLAILAILGGLVWLS
ncbi:MAG: hypothetical protein BRC40_15945 [Cyanobacteria bacterium QH_8_48_120]|nr:MAG: hypothetical protein BRC34_08130 [Cyanobacteria bacterium QH_1_48_107]PSO56394.1 MAG: hypothetical protein BRC39_17335 [Cyanobacteria bacterium QH_7_48_89]PSO60434.1 MAG: hypothetical protein BRC35_01725 [Cyanobacteria bacterium QH_10_48_56]PSO60912.1 MAG: hypothetical protein BRC36_12800 [Cyanobacteria bacterium QH_2_48_84]PSO62290.1 MAG: hypothetical protein BRC38_16130 [Cyanobacteria bacterium QH_6_48_35]PSO68924.1 MAG: hypothetical protein BRC42_12735 [Cyanobacteria bacterium QS_1_